MSRIKSIEEVLAEDEEQGRLLQEEEERVERLAMDLTYAMPDRWSDDEKTLLAVAIIKKVEELL